MFAGDGDRERTAAALREHYVGGRLSLEDYSSRIDSVLVARSRADLRAALAGLTAFPEATELAEQGRRVARAAARGALLLAATALYALFSVVLLLVLGVTLIVHGASGPALLAFLVVWLVPTYLLSRLWRGPRSTTPRRKDAR